MKIIIINNKIFLGYKCGIAITIFYVFPNNIGKF